MSFSTSTGAQLNAVAIPLTTILVNGQQHGSAHDHAAAPPCMLVKEIIRTRASPARSSVSVLSTSPSLPSLAKISRASAPGHIDIPDCSSLDTLITSPYVSPTFSASLIAIRDGVPGRGATHNVPQGAITNSPASSLESMWPWIESAVDETEAKVKGEVMVFRKIWASLIEAIHKLRLSNNKIKTDNEQRRDQIAQREQAEEPEEPEEPMHGDSEWDDELLDDAIPNQQARRDVDAGLGADDDDDDEDTADSIHDHEHRFGARRYVCLDVNGDWTRTLDRELIRQGTVTDFDRAQEWLRRVGREHHASRVERDEGRASFNVGDRSHDAEARSSERVFARAVDCTCHVRTHCVCYRVDVSAVRQNLGMHTRPANHGQPFNGLTFRPRCIDHQNPFASAHASVPKQLNTLGYSYARHVQSSVGSSSQPRPRPHPMRRATEGLPCDSMFFVIQNEAECDDNMDDADQPARRKGKARAVDGGCWFANGAK